MPLITGVDVSSYQSASTYPIAGMSFAIVKATESTTYENPKYAAQIAHARTNGLVVGHYHFATGTTSSAQVAYFASKADVRAGEIIALDWEESSVTPAARDEWLKATRARFPYNRVILYCNVDYWDRLDPTHSTGDGLWIADYSHPAGHPNISGAWVFNQYSSAGGIDHSVANFTSLAALVAWALELAPRTPVTTSETEDNVSATSVNGRAGVAWPSGRFHAVGVNYDPAQGNQPKLRIVLCLNTGPYVLDSAWEPAKGCDVFEIPAKYVKICQGVILEGAPASVYDVTAS
jgi:hypothetical protein